MSLCVSGLQLFVTLILHFSAANEHGFDMDH